MRLDLLRDPSGNLHLLERDDHEKITYWHTYGKDAKSARADIDAWISGAQCADWGGNQVRRHDDSEVASMSVVDSVGR